MGDETKKTLVEKCQDDVTAGYISYLVSAPLHGRGSLAFWQSGVKTLDAYGHITRAICVIDLIWHVALWLILLIFEIWTYSVFQTYTQTTAAVAAVMSADGLTEISPAADAFEHRMGAVPVVGNSRVLLDELYIGAFGSFLIAFIGLVISIVFGLMGQPSGKAWPSTICFLFGGLKVSLVFSVLIVLVATEKWHGFTTATEVGADGNQETVTMRQMLLWAVLLKGLLIAQLSANEKFWGDASDDDQNANICMLLKGIKGEPTLKSSPGFLPGAYKTWPSQA